MTEYETNSLEKLDKIIDLNTQNNELHNQEIEVLQSNQELFNTIIENQNTLIKEITKEEPADENTPVIMENLENIEMGINSLVTLNSDTTMTESIVTLADSQVNQLSEKNELIHQEVSVYFSVVTGLILGYIAIKGMFSVWKN